MRTTYSGVGPHASASGSPITIWTNFSVLVDIYFSAMLPNFAMASLTSCTGVLMDAGVWYFDQRSCCLVPAASSNAPAASTNAPLDRRLAYFFRSVLACSSLRLIGCFVGHIFSLRSRVAASWLFPCFRSASRRPREALRFMGVSCLIEFLLRQGCSMLVFRNGTIVEQSMTVIHHMLGRIQGLMPCWELRELHR